jgi:FixJ family two-component response regulator
LSDVEPVVLVVDDDAAVRSGLESLLRSVGLRARSFASPQELLDAPQPAGPACLVLDIRLPGSSGLDLPATLAAAGFRPLPVIFITGYGDVPMSVQAMKLGAVDFLLKPFREQQLLDAVHLALEADRVARQERAELEELRRLYATLTPREREIMGLVAAGRLNKQIAADLGLSEVTVKVHRGQVMRKMRAGTLADLVKIALRLDLSAPQP